VYDMRANMPAFGKRTPFTRDYFRTPEDAAASQLRDKFEDVFGSDPRGGPAALAARQDSGEAGRWRRFTREQIAQRGDSLDISWLKDSGAASADQSRDDPSLVAGLALKELNAAVSELRSLLEELGEDPDAVLEAVVADDSAEDGEGAIA
jgi:type I restriction enzyme M protein